jgi:hypothetical protein
MAENVQTLVRLGLWEQLDERHKTMVRALGNDVPEEADWPSWSTYLDEFEVAADLARETNNIAILLSVIERGYRRILFLQSPDVTRIDTNTILTTADANDIDAMAQRALKEQ